jgi:hypothetical protein
MVSGGRRRWRKRAYVANDLCRGLRLYKPSFVGRRRQKEMKYVIEERFTDELGFTFPCGEAIENLYIMRHSENVFELLDKGRYEIAKGQYRE